MQSIATLLSNAAKCLRGREFFKEALNETNKCERIVQSTFFSVISPPPPLASLHQNKGDIPSYPIALHLESNAISVEGVSSNPLKTPINIASLHYGTF